MVAETVKISKFAVKKAAKRAAKYGGKVVVKVPNQTGQLLYSAMKNFVKVALGAGAAFFVSEGLRTANRENYNCFTGEYGMLIKSAKNSVRD